MAHTAAHYNNIIKYLYNSIIVVGIGGGGAQRDGALAGLRHTSYRILKVDYRMSAVNNLIKVSRHF